MAESVQLDGFKIVGISVRTTNEDGRSATDIMQLWQKFYSENITSKILNQISSDVYSIYTDYEHDYTAAYTTILGHRVTSLDNIPAGFVGREFKGGNYLVFKARGERPAAVTSKWQEIWDKDNQLHRLYSADFEVYGEKSQDRENAEVEIFIAVK